MHFLLFCFALATSQEAIQNKNMLCLGDSYTIGQSVQSAERFPEQTVLLLEQQKTHYNNPKIIAQTGWTTADLIAAISKKSPTKNYDCVTLLIGVNDQFRGIDTALYHANFESVLQTAISCAGNKPNHVYVLSIPDYGVTPFALSGRQSPKQISNEIATFNAINKAIALANKVHYIDITPDSKKAQKDLSLLAYDQLHPSGKMYALWANDLCAAMLQEIKK